MGDKKKSYLTLEDFLIAFTIAFSIVFVLFLTTVAIGYKITKQQTPPEQSIESSLAAEPARNVTEPPTEPSVLGGGVSDETDDESASENIEALKTGSYILPSGVDLLFYDSVRNDVTGRWRYSATSSSTVPADFALEYYNEMFSSDDELHGVWNTTLGTMTSISTYGNMLFVDTHEYVDGEEHDANLMFSGMLLDSKIIDIATGEEMEPMQAPIQSQSPASTPVPTRAPATPATQNTGTVATTDPTTPPVQQTQAPTATNALTQPSVNSDNGSGKWGESSTTNEITGDLNRTAYWVSSGKSYHFSESCPSLSRSINIQTGTLQDALNAGKTDPCNNCANGT